MYTFNVNEARVRKKSPFIAIDYKQQTYRSHTERERGRQIITQV